MHSDFDSKGISLLISSWILNINSIFSRDNISFTAGLIVSILAGIHYIIQIKNNTKNK